MVLQGGVYSQTGRRAVTVGGTADKPVTIRAADGQEPTLIRPAVNSDRFNNIEFVDRSHAPTEHNYQPKPGSVLVGHADPDVAPPLDFSGKVRQSPLDAGAYQSR